MAPIFGNDSKKGRLDWESNQEFEAQVEEFYASLSLERECEYFVQSFNRSKAGKSKWSAGWLQCILIVFDSTWNKNRSYKTSD